MNVTLVFSVAQALLASKAGASYVSPFLGRLDDNGGEGLSLIKDISETWKNQGITGCKILAASIRSVHHVEMCAKIGAHAATIPYAIFAKLVEHDLTNTGLEKFLEDWRAVKSEGRA